MDALGYTEVPPTTSGVQIVMKQYKVVKVSGPIVAKPDTCVGYLQHGSISDTLLHTLLETTHILCSFGPLQKKYSSQRREGLTMRIGF